MRALIDTVMNGGLKLVPIGYLAIAFLVGIQKHRDSDTPHDGAAWPITLLIDAVQRQ